MFNTCRYHVLPQHRVEREQECECIVSGLTKRIHAHVIQGSSKPPPKHLKDGCILCFFQPNKEHLYGHKAQSADDTQTLKLGNNKSTTIIDVTSDAKDIYVPEVEGTSLDHAFQFSSQNYIDGHIAYPEYSHRRQSIASTEEEVDSAAETLFSQIPHKISHVASDKPLNVVTASKLTSEFLTANQALVERQANQGHDNITHQEDKMKILKIAEKFLAAEAKRYEERITDAQVSELRSHEEETASLQPRENKTLASATVATTSLSDISSTSAETTALKISKTQRRREERKRARMLKAEKLGKTFITSVEI